MPTCSTCQRKAFPMYRCTGCREDFYCDAACQAKDWENHREECQKEFVRKIAPSSGYIGKALRFWTASTDSEPASEVSGASKSLHDQDSASDSERAPSPSVDVADKMAGSYHQQEDDAVSVASSADLGIIPSVSDVPVEDFVKTPKKQAAPPQRPPGSPPNQRSELTDLIKQQLSPQEKAVEQHAKTLNLSPGFTKHVRSASKQMARAGSVLLEGPNMDSMQSLAALD